MKRGHGELRALALADWLVGYWRDKGFEVTAWVERIQVPHERDTSNAAGAHWVVRSDMVNGHPVKRRVS